MTPLTPRSRTVAALLLGALPALGLACGGTSEPPLDAEAPAAAEASRQEPQHGGTLVMASISDVAGWNPYTFPATRISQELLTHLFLRLVEEQADFEDHPPTVAPMLAERWEWEEGRKAVVFHLRENARWSDGHPVTADDVLFTWEAQNHPAVGWVDRHLKASIAGVDKIDEHAVRFRFNTVNTHLLLDANEGGILPAHVWSKLPFEEWRQNGPWFHDNLVVSGPFKLESWSPQQEIVLARNEHYYDADRPYLDRVIVRIMPDRSSQLTQLLSRQLDVMETLSSTDIERIRTSPDHVLQSYWSRNFFFLAYRLDNPLFSSAAVRHALTLAIDREAIVETIYGEWGKVGVGPILTTTWAFNDELEPLPYDPDEARRILAAEGFAPGDDGVLAKGGRRFSFEILSNTGNPQRVDAMVLIQEQLRRVGIEVRQRLMESNLVGTRLTSGDFESLLLGLAMPTDLDLEYAWHSGGGSNYFGYSNPELDRVIDAARSVPTAEQLEPLVKRAQALIFEDQPASFLWEAQRVHAFDKRVKNAQPNVLRTYWHLWDWWIDPALSDSR